MGVPYAWSAREAALEPAVSQQRAISEAIRCTRRAIERACIQNMTSTAVRLPVTTRDNVLTNSDNLVTEVTRILRRQGYRVAIAVDVPFTLYVSWTHAHQPEHVRTMAV
jgi:hypothetical protein